MAVPNTDNIQTTTLQLIRRRLADNIFKANPLAAWMLANGRVKTASGGKFIVEPLMYATNATVQSYGGYDRLNIAPTQELTEADYNWRQAAVSISISGEEELKNNGPEAVFDLLKAKIKVADMSLRQYFDEKMHAPVANKDTNKDILGLDEIIDSRLNFSTLGSIDGNAYSFWRNQIGPDGDGDGAMPTGTGSGEDNDEVHVGATAASMSTLGEVLNRMMNQCGRQQTQPDLIITSQAVFEHYENEYGAGIGNDNNAGLLRVSGNSLLDVGFHTLKYRGATMVWNENIPKAEDMPGGSADADKNVIYFLNSNHIGFTLHSRRNFTMSQFVSPWDQDAKVAQILVAGNMTCNNRRHLGVCWIDFSG